MRLTYICARCHEISYDSLRPCAWCGNFGEIITVIDYSPVSYGELIHHMNRAPKPWPLDKVFIPEPWPYLSIDQLRAIAEHKRNGGVFYVLGK